MRKLMKISLLLLILISIMFITGKVYAKPSCNVTLELETESATFKEGDTVVVNIKMSNINSDEGIVTFQGILEYDDNSLTLAGMEGKNNWRTPIAGNTYNPEDGSIAIVKDGVAKQGEEIVFSITFKVNKGSKQNPCIKLTNIMVADGSDDGLGDINLAFKELTIKEENAGGSGSGTGGSDNAGGSGSTGGAGGSGGNSGTSGNNSNGSNNVNDKDKGKDDTTINGKLPKTGQGSIMLLSCGGIAVVCSIIFYKKLLA